MQWLVSKMPREDKLFLPLTLGELRIVYWNFIDLQKPLTVQKSADFNHLRNFQLKFRNYLLRKHVTNFGTGLVVAFTAHRLVGQRTFKKLLNMTSRRNAQMLMIPANIYLFFQF
jgi:hypothetical protein